MTKHVVTSGLIAGFVVALLATLLQFSFLERNILLAERYESGELMHFAGVGVGDHAEPSTAEAGHDNQTYDHTAHDHAADDGPFWLRQVKTLLTMTITYCGYGLVMIAGMTIARHFGKTIGAAEAMLWGLAGFGVFMMAPAMGLEPLLPGVEGAALRSRQAWWLFCAGSSAAGLAVLAYGFGQTRLIGIVLLAIPHIIGAPHQASFTGLLPPELASQHAARSLGVGLVAWVTLGLCGRWLLDRPA